MPQSIDVIAWALITAICGMAAVTIQLTGLSFDWASALTPALACLVLIALAIIYCSVRPDPKLATALMSSAQLIAFFTAGAASLSYAVAAAGFPLWDSNFLAWDQALSFDWRAYLAFADRHPWLGSVYDAAYNSLVLQFVGVLLALAMSDRLSALRVAALKTERSAFC